MGDVEATAGAEVIITLGIMLHLGLGRNRVILVIGRQLRLDRCARAARDWIKV